MEARVFQCRKKYSNIERKELDILYGLQKFNRDCFGREVQFITDHKSLVAMFKKDVAMILTDYNVYY